MKMHKFDTISFLSGLVITSIGLLFLIPRDAGDLFALIGDLGNWSSWLWAVLFLVVGAAVLAPLASGRQTAADESVTPDPLRRNVR